MLDSDGKIIGTKLGQNSTAYVSSQWWRENLTKNLLGGSQPYRFVFLDGCQTAAGDWPETVGTGKGTNDLSFYQNPSLNKARTRPVAFVGWQTDMGGAGWGPTAGYKYFRTEWINEWTKPAQPTLIQAFVNAHQNSSWPPGDKFVSSFRVYGYHVMLINEFNHRGDWQTQ